MTFPNSKVFNVQKELVTTLSFEIEPRSGDRLLVGKETYEILGSRRTFNEQGKCSLEVSVTNAKNFPSGTRQTVTQAQVGNGRTIEVVTWS